MQGLGNLQVFRSEIIPPDEVRVEYQTITIGVDVDLELLRFHANLTEQDFRWMKSMQVRADLPFIVRNMRS